ncbi:MAG: thioesterase [bacterium]|nr:thioesterase [bacterium]
MKTVTLFCFPYAGGSAAVFNKWRHYLEPRIQLHAVELAGRGRRIYDPLYRTMEEAVDDVYKQINDQLNKVPYAFFGHSLGGIIAYELAQKLRGRKHPQPVHVFFAGRGAPHVPGEDEKMFHQLPEDAFKKEISELGGTPGEFFQHPELIDVLLPMLKSDFKIAETYKYGGKENTKPLDYDISVLIGKDEEISAPQVHGWREHTTGICTIHYFPGEHFFINEETGRIVKRVNRTLVGS